MKVLKRTQYKDQAGMKFLQMYPKPGRGVLYIQKSIVIPDKHSACNLHLGHAQLDCSVEDISVRIRSKGVCMYVCM